MNTSSRHISRRWWHLATLLAALLLPHAVWAQTDYSGTYYIGVYGKNGTTSQYNPSDPDNNFYLCPTESWLYYVATNSCNHADDPGNGQPFLTSYKCKGHNNGTISPYYDLTKAVWVITKHPTSNYYYIQQQSTGKYLVFNEQISYGSSNAGANRIRVHLETIESPNVPDDKALFAITYATSGNYSGYWLFHPKTAGDDYYMNITDGNHDNLIGTNGKTDGPTVTGYAASKNVGGTIGQWNEANNTSSFYLEDYIQRPTISYNASNLIEITDPTGNATAIYYTIDGTTPDASSTQYNGAFDPADNVTTIKAVSLIGGKLSNVATYNIIVHLGDNHKRLIQSQNNAWDTDFHFYMIPGDPDANANNITRVNTTSLFRPSMEWYFLNAGVEGNVQYYYIVNNANGMYLCYDATNKVYMEAFSNDNKFKFKIVESPTLGTCNIYPYGQNILINKATNNANNGPVNTVNYSASNANSGNTRWKFILPNELDRNNPFTVSTPSSQEYSYYKIANVGDNTHYIVPGNTNATTSNVSDTTMNWYFEVAQAADDSDWLTYFHIRNALTGDYLYFTKNANNAGACLVMCPRIDTITSGNEDRCLFTWAKTADANVNYYIIPKKLKDVSQNQFSTLRKHDSNTSIITNLTRGAGRFAWTFEPSNYKCAQPVIRYNSTEHGYVITATESDAKIYYKIGTGELTPTTGTLYDGAISVANLNVESTTIRAIAARNNDGTDASDIASVTVYRVDTPQFTTTEDGKVRIDCDTVGVTIYYEMGTSGAVNDPTTSSTPYTGPISNAAGQVIKAIAVKGGLINSQIATSNVITFACATPVIRKTTSTTFTITCSFPASGYHIRYNMGANPDDPTPTSGTYSEGAATVTFNESDLPFTVKAIAYADNYDNSDVATQLLTADLLLDTDGYYIIASYEDYGVFVTMVNGNPTLAEANYKIIDDIDLTNGVGAISEPFTGELKGVAKADGSWPVLSKLSHAIFNTVNGGTVKSLMLDNVAISGGTNVGAICNEATGASRIYNCGILATGSTVTTDEDGYTKITSCSSTISGSNYVGGLVGLLDGTSRVINCFSYANVSGGAEVGGIVGHNNVATTATNPQTMVMNCVFYGEVVSGSSRAPIYNGEIITNVGENTGVSNFNYFRLESAYIQNNNIAKVYNCALGAEDRFLQRFEFYRHLLNSHRELAGWWATGTYSSSEMMKWVLEPSQIGTSTPYPILKSPGRYPSVVNIDAENATTGKPRNQGGKLGTLAVTIRMGSGGAVFGPPTGAAITTSSLTLNITDKDTTHFNYNYYKVQLPYYNDVGSHNYRKHSDGTSRVVTGWKIVSITGGTAGSYSTGEDVTYDGSGNLTATPYNFADRNCTNKDLYSVSGRVFNQGAYWDVPYGVTAITIEPYWAKCVYLADSNADMVYDQAMTAGYGVPTVGGGKIYTNGNSYSIAGESQMVFTDKGKAIATSNSGLFHEVTGTPGNQTVYDYAVVLVGNYHFYSNLDADKSKPYTVTSVDLDGDNEPDYSYILRFDGRNKVHPVRVDFINIPGLGMAQKSTGGTGTYNFGIMQPLDWFESTNTSLFRVTQFEYDCNKDGKTRGAAPYILQGGVMEQWVLGQNQGYANNTTYFHVGGNVWFKEFHRGTHQDENFSAKHPPVSVTGGDFDQFHLTGLYKASATTFDDNAECYITGGRFRVVAGTGMDGLGTSDGKGNITWIIDNADIKEFYAGSFNAANPAIGNLHTIVNGGHIDFFYGGPKFGDMSSGKTVTTTATGTTFGTFFGAGYGGSSYSRQAPYNHNNVINFPHNTSQAGNDATWNAWLNRFYKQDYNSTYVGVSTQFSYQFLPMSGNTDNCARIFVEYVKFSLATTHSVTSTLTECTILNNFYGGGSLGKVDGTVTSILDDCTVYGNVFGAGFSASLPTVEVDSIDGFRVEPYYYSDLGTYRTGVKGSTTTYTWAQTAADHRIEDAADDAARTALAVDQENKILYTDENLSKSNLGSVNTATLTLKGNTTVGTLLNNGSLKANTGNVYGGGDESTVSGNTTVTLQGNAHVLGNVFGGGNQGPVGGNSSVTIQD